MRCVEPPDIDLDATAGDPFFIRGVAANLKRESVEDTLDAIHGHLRDTLKIESAWKHRSRRRLTSQQMLLHLEAWGCSAHAQIACHLARACGIPAILVKTLDLKWIEHDNQGDGRGSGHVYVEILAEGRPALWDAQGGRLQRRYAPDSMFVAVGQRVIYDKGGPDTVVLSHHGEEWEEQTRRLFPGPTRPSK